MKLQSFCFRLLNTIIHGHIQNWISTIYSYPVMRRPCFPGNLSKRSCLVCTLLVGTISISQFLSFSNAQAGNGSRSIIEIKILGRNILVKYPRKRLQKKTTKVQLALLKSKVFDFMQLFTIQYFPPMFLYFTQLQSVV